MKICLYVQSANRPEYLEPTLAAIEKHLDFGNHEVDRICIDDYPLNRSPRIKELFDSHNFTEQYFHKTNWGVTRTWGHFWNLIKHRNYDYIFHIEDDSVLQQDVSIDEYIEILNSIDNIKSLSLRRQEWYNDASEDRESRDGLPISDDDVVVGDYRVDMGDRYLLTAAVLYPGWVAQLPIMSFTGSNPGEGTVAWFLKQYHNLLCGRIKNSDGSHIIEHVGEYFHGTRTRPNDAGYENHKTYQVGHKYCSKTGKYLGKE